MLIHIRHSFEAEDTNVEQHGDMTMRYFSPYRRPLDLPTIAPENTHRNPASEARRFDERAARHSFKIQIPTQRRTK